MTRKELLDLGYTEEQVNQLMDLNGKAIEKVKSERDEAIAKYNDTQLELDKRSQDFEELQKNSTASEELKQQFETLNNEYKDYKEQATKREHDIKFNSALGLALAKSGTIDEVSLKANLDLSKIELSEEGLNGLDEQIKSLKENKSFLFGENLDSGFEHNKPLQKTTIEDQIKKGLRSR